MLIDYGNTHSFNNYKLAKIFTCCIYLVLKIQVMIVARGTINFLGKFHKINITMGGYLLDIPINYIQVSGVDVVLGFQRLQSLGT
jgi:hypothetical protein